MGVGFYESANGMYSVSYTHLSHIRRILFMKKRRLFLCLLFMLAVMLLPATIQAASAPGTVKLSSISAPAYNKINVKWKKTSGATHYICLLYTSRCV